MISVKFLPKGRRWPRYQMAQKHCRKFQSPEQGAQTLQATDDRRQTDGRTTTYSEHEHEFTFAKNWFDSPYSMAKVTASIVPVRPFSWGTQVSLCNYMLQQTYALSSLVLVTVTKLLFSLCQFDSYCNSHQIPNSHLTLVWAMVSLVTPATEGINYPTSTLKHP